MDAILELGARDLQSEEIYIVIDTPRRSRNKFKYDEKLRLFKQSSPGLNAPSNRSPPEYGAVKPETNRRTKEINEPESKTNQEGDGRLCHP